MLLAASAWSAQAATYHVAKNGRDTNAGSAARPFLTISRAVRALAAGDDVVVHRGVYSETVTIWNAHGKAASPIYVRAAAGEKPVIDGSGMQTRKPSSNGVVVIAESEFVVFTGFEVRNSAAAGIFVAGSRNVTVSWNHVHHAQKFGIHASDDGGRSANIAFVGNFVHHTVMNNVRRTMKEGWTQAMSVLRTDGARIEANTVFDNMGEGIDVIVSRHVLVTGNRVHDNYGANIYLDNAQYTTVDRNFVYSNAKATTYFREGRPAGGICVAVERYDVAFPVTQLIVTNNIVLWCRYGFSYGNWGRGGGLHRTTVANNTFYGSTDVSVLIENASHDTTTIANNVFVNFAGKPYVSAPIKGITFVSNAWYGGNAATRRAGRGDVNADPRLVRGGGDHPEDYRLAPGSPLRKAGTPIGVVPHDYRGVRRSARFSIGAYGE